jgi:hypothetical protein
MNYCRIEDCTTKVHGNGLCQRHYHRVRRHGDPSIVKTPKRYSGSDNPNWAGDDVSYDGMHYRLRSQLGLASAYECPCGAQAAEWAYQHGCPDERISDQGFPYSLNPDEYLAQCQSCHKILDMAVSA